MCLCVRVLLSLLFWASAVFTFLCVWMCCRLIYMLNTRSPRLRRLSLHLSSVTAHADVHRSRPPANTIVRRAVCVLFPERRTAWLCCAHKSIFSVTGFSFLKAQYFSAVLLSSLFFSLLFFFLRMNFGHEGRYALGARLSICLLSHRCSIAIVRPSFSALSYDIIPFYVIIPFYEVGFTPTEHEMCRPRANVNVNINVNVNVNVNVIYFNVNFNVNVNVNVTC